MQATPVMQVTPSYGSNFFTNHIIKKSYRKTLRATDFDTREYN